MSTSSNKQQKKGKDGMGKAGKRKEMVKDWCGASCIRKSKCEQGRLWCRAKSGSKGFRRRFQEALVQSQVRFNRVPEKVGEVLVQSQVRFNRVLEKVPEEAPGGIQQGSEKVPEKVGEALVQSQVVFNRVPERCRRRSAMGGFGAEFQQGSEEGEALVQS